MDGITAHPLSWPVGRARTEAHRRDRPKFKAPAFGAARDGLLAELRRLGAAGVILSTNVALRHDGLPLAGQRQPADPGVAVHFRRKGRALCLACDRWTRVEDNLRAIADAVECIRTIERRGTGDMVDAAFAGFAALPPAAGDAPKRPWWEVLGVPAHAPTETVAAAYKRLALELHPSRGGDGARMAEVNAARDQFNRERGLP